MTRHRLLAGLFGLVLLLRAVPSEAQIPGGSYDVARERAEVARIVIENAQGAPARVALYDEGTLRLEAGFQFIGRDVASRYLRTFSREDPADLVGVLMVGGRSESWTGVIRLVRDGFVDVSAITQWTPEDLLASIKDDIALENAERAKKSLRRASWKAGASHRAMTRRPIRSCGRSGPMSPVSPR